MGFFCFECEAEHFSDTCPVAFLRAENATLRQRLEAVERARAGQASEVVRLKRMIEAAYAENVALRQRLEATEADIRLMDVFRTTIDNLTTAVLRLMDVNGGLRKRLEAAEKWAQAEWHRGNMLAGWAAGNVSNAGCDEASREAGIARDRYAALAAGESSG